jgi:hypothetical protein
MQVLPLKARDLTDQGVSMAALSLASMNSYGLCARPVAALAHEYAQGVQEGRRQVRTLFETHIQSSSIHTCAYQQQW